MGEDGVEILVYENEDTVHNPIKFYHDFDETDIRDLFEATSKQAKAVVEAHNADIYVMPKEKG